MEFFSHQNILPAIVLIVVGVIMTYLARSIRAGNVELLAGYDASQVTDKTGLAAWAGGNLLMLGYVQTAAGLLAFGNVYAGGAIFFLTTLILVGRTVLGSRRFQR